MRHYPNLKVNSCLLQICGRGVYLEFPDGRPEVYDAKTDASGQQTETLYSMLLAPLATALDDIPIVGNLRLGSQTSQKLLQIGEIGSGRLATLVRAGGHAYILSVFLEKIWTSSTIGTTAGIADLGSDSYFIPNRITDITESVYVWKYSDVLTESGKYPVSTNVGILLPDSKENWGWLLTTTPQFSGHVNVYPLDNVIEMFTKEMMGQTEEEVPTDQAILEDQLEELNEYANHRLNKKPIPQPVDPNSCPVQNTGVILEEAIAWITMAAANEKNTRIDLARKKFLLEYVSVVNQIDFESRYASPSPWLPGVGGQQYATHTVSNKTWATYSVCSYLALQGIAAPRFTFTPGAAYFGVSNDIDTPNKHGRYPYTQ